MITSRSIFYKFFPVPKYMEMRDTGLDLSDDTLRFSELLSNGQQLDLGDFGEYAIPPGTITLGRIQNADNLRELLKKIKKEHNLKFVRISLPETYVYHVEMEIAQVRKKELRESIELQLEEYVPLKVSEVFFDYDVAPAPKQRPGILMAVVSVIPKDIVLPYVEVFTSVGLTLVSIEVEANALSRALIPKGDLGTFMIINIGRVKTGVCVVSRGLVRFSSDIDSGGNSILSAFEKNLGVSREEAESLKKKYLCGPYETPLPEEVKQSIEPIFLGLVEEINKHFIYWHTQKDKSGTAKERIEKIILSGTESTLLGVQDYVSAGLRSPVEMANVWTNIFSFDHQIPKISYNDSLRFGTALGLALSSNQSEVYL